MVQQIHSKVEFDNVLASAGDKLVVVDFTASWCGPCRVISPVFDQLSETYSGNVIFIKVDVDEVSDLAQDAGIRGMPTFQFYKNGNKVDEFSGANPNMLKQKVAALQ